MRDQLKSQPNAHRFFSSANERVSRENDRDTFYTFDAHGYTDYPFTMRRQSDEQFA